MVTWYPQSAADGDTHRGTLCRGMVDTVCGIRFPPVRRFALVAIRVGAPPDAAKVCPRCQAASTEYR